MRDDSGLSIVKETTNGVDTFYVHGPGIDNPLARRSGADVSYYLKDHLGSVRQVTDSMGTIQNGYVYNPWGENIYASETVGNLYGYTARETSVEKNYYRQRYQDPWTGRFASKDLIFGSMKKPVTMHPYLYVRNNPTKYSDPLGLVTIDKSCSAYKEDLEKYFIEAVEIGKPCLPERWRVFFQMRIDSGIIIECTNEENCGSAHRSPPTANNKRARTVSMGSFWNVYPPESCADSPEGVIFHELLYLIGMEDSPGTPNPYACEKKCFDSEASQKYSICDCY